MDFISKKLIWGRAKNSCQWQIVQLATFWALTVHITTHTKKYIVEYVVDRGTHTRTHTYTHTHIQLYAHIRTFCAIQPLPVAAYICHSSYGIGIEALPRANIIFLTFRNRFAVLFEWCVCVCLCFDVTLYTDTMFFICIWLVGVQL